MWAVCNDKCEESSEGRAYEPSEDSICQGLAAGTGDRAASSAGVLCIAHHAAACAAPSAGAPDPCPACSLSCNHVCSQTHHTHPSPTPCPHSPSPCSSPSPHATTAPSRPPPSKAGGRIEQVWVPSRCSRSTTPATAAWDAPAPANACTHAPVLAPPVSVPACDGSSSEWEKLGGSCSGKSRGVAEASGRPPATVPTGHDPLATAVTLPFSPPLPE